MSELIKPTQILVKIKLSNGTQKKLKYVQHDHVENLMYKIIDLTINEKIKKDLEELMNYCVVCQKYSDLTCLSCRKVVCDRCYGNHHH